MKKIHCPNCNKTAIDTTQYGRKLYLHRCRSCGHSWNEIRQIRLQRPAKSGPYEDGTSTRGAR